METTSALHEGLFLSGSVKIIIITPTDNSDFLV